MANTTRAMAVINRDDNTFQHLLAHYSNPEAFKLNDKQAEILERWRMIFTLQLRGHSRMHIVKILEKDGLSTSQAYADIKNVESFFGNVMKADKEFQRVLFLERAHDDYIRAKQKGNDELAAKINNSIAKYNGLDKKDVEDQYNAEKLENNTIELAFGKETTEMLKKMSANNNGNVIDFNSFNVVDIPHEDLPADEED